jgi:hypothetical protein
MKNIKTIWEDNKKKIVVGTIIGVGATAAILTRRYYKGNFNLLPKSLSYISWKPSGKFITLEDAKAALDMNAGNDESFAIFKHGCDYIGLVFSDDVIIPQISGEA